MTASHDVSSLPSGLGRLLEVKHLDRPVIGRVYALLTFVLAAAVLVIAFRLTPDENQLGTHEQLGLHPCGFEVMTGYPCPTCGMTTAFAYAVRGHLLLAMYAQFAGFVLAVFTLLVGLAAGFAAIAGWYPGINWYRVNPERVVWGLIILIAAAWGGKILIGLADGSLPTH